MIAELFSTVAPLFLCAGLGFAWGRFGRPYDTRMIAQLVSLIGAPCLIFSTLADIDGLSAEIGEIALATAAAIGAVALCATLVLRLMGLPLRTYLAPLTFPNVGNLGLPLCLFAYGDPGLALGIGFFAVTASLQLTFGQWLLSGAASLKPVVRAPIPYAVGLGVLFMVTDLEVPAFIHNTTNLLGGFAIPLMIITLGVSLSQLKIVSLPRTLLLSVLRLGIGLGAGFALAALFGFDGMQRGVLIMLCGMPTAIFNYLFAKYYDNEPEEVASIVVLSTAIAFAMLPLLVYAVT